MSTDNCEGRSIINGFSGNMRVVISDDGHTIYQYIYYHEKLLVELKLSSKTSLNIAHSLISHAVPMLNAAQVEK